jgi:putative nucleotidyltransferase with HDIG domain
MRVMPRPVDQFAQDNSPNLVTHANGVGGSRCLVVDDEPRLRQALVRLMQGAGFRCFEAGSAQDALAVLEREPLELVLSDMRMPGMDGASLLRRIREGHPDVAVVMITAVAEVEVAVSCLSAGAMDYITKPFIFEEVRARVTQALEKRRLLLENRNYQEQLEQRVKAQAQRLEDLFLASVQSLAEALELKDPYTRGHSIRVSRYAVAISRMLGIDSATIRHIELGGQLHDIGKIGVREDVLNKPGPLTKDEYEHIMTHPVLGWRILRPLLSDNTVVLNIVRSHHERIDGKGVPDGLGGSDIAREARIVAVADAFDAMMSRRPYRQGLSYIDTLDELKRMCGTQFDGDVVAAFLEAAATGTIVLDTREPATDPTRARRLAQPAS